MISVQIRATLVIVLTAALLLIILLFTSVVSAQMGPIQLSVTPNTLALSPGEKATVLILASISPTNPDPLKPMTITLSSFTGAGVDLHFLTDAKQQVPSSRDNISWLTEITASETGVSPGTLYLMAEYALADAGGQIITRVTTATLGITARPVEAVTDVLSVTLYSDIQTLLDLQERNAILVLTNISNAPISITNVVPTLTISNVDQLKASVIPRPRLPLPLLPQQTQEISITLGVGSSIVAGNNLLVVRVDAKWMRGELGQQGSIVVTKAFQSGVFGESAILTAVGIPTLLLLPGFLMMISLGLIRRMLRPPTVSTSEPDPSSQKGAPALANSEVWFWAISFSLVLFLIYPWISRPWLRIVTSHWQAPRNLLTGYGFIDIVYLWLIAALAGGIFAAIGQWSAPTRRRLIRWRLEQFTPTSFDNEVMVLEKLVRNDNRNFQVEKRRYKDEAEEVCVLHKAIDEPGKIWVTPRINVEKGLRPSNNPKKEYDEKVGRPVESGDSATALKALKELIDNQHLKLAFAQVGDELKRPTPVKEEDLKGEEREVMDPILNILALST